MVEYRYNGNMKVLPTNKGERKMDIDYVVAVNGFSGPSYSKGYITFKFDKVKVPFVIGMNGTSPYHITNEDLNLLPFKIPPFIKEKYEDLNDWGQNTLEVELSKLMMTNKFVLDRELNGKLVIVQFKWVGPVWNRKAKGENKSIINA